MLSPAFSASSVIRYRARANESSARQPTRAPRPLSIRRSSVSAGYRWRHLPGWSALLRGASREALESLALELLEHPGATAHRAEIQEDLAAVALFFESEALALARARTRNGYPRYPVPQGDRDLLFAEARALRAAT